jgi:4-hydroxy-tetrahydrodipicolinate reductase
MRIALHGMGKMGHALGAAAATRGWQVVHRLDQGDDVGVLLTQAPVDVMIDFSASAAVLPLLEKVLPLHIPLVVGTTGWLDQLPQARALVEQAQGALVVGSNFSIGVNLLFQLNRQLSTWMGAHAQFEPYIEERHHAAKADAPSGTALRLAKDLIAAHPSKSAIATAAELANRAPHAHELSVGSIRAGSIPGTHTVGWASVVETIELTHTAHSRDGFAEGALFAAAWMIGKTGFYQFEDLFAMNHG